MANQTCPLRVAKTALVVVRLPAVENPNGDGGVANQQACEASVHGETGVVAPIQCTRDTDSGRKWRGEPESLVSEQRDSAYRIGNKSCTRIPSPQLLRIGCCLLLLLHPQRQRHHHHHHRHRPFSSYPSSVRCISSSLFSPLNSQSSARFLASCLRTRAQRRILLDRLRQLRRGFQRHLRTQPNRLAYHPIRRLRCRRAPRHLVV